MEKVEKEEEKEYDEYGYEKYSLEHYVAELQRLETLKTVHKIKGLRNHIAQVKDVIKWYNKGQPKNWLLRKR